MHQTKLFSDDTHAGFLPFGWVTRDLEVSHQCRSERPGPWGQQVPFPLIFCSSAFVIHTKSLPQTQTCEKGYLIGHC